MNSTPPCAPPTRASGRRARGRGRVSGPRSPPHDRDRRGAAQQGGEKVAAGDGRVGEGDALAREQQRSVEVVFAERLLADPLRRPRSAPGCGRRSRWWSGDDATDDRERPAAPRRPRARGAGGAAARPAAVRLASRKARSVALSSCSWPSRHSSATASRAPRYRSRGVASAFVPVARRVGEAAVRCAGPARPPRASRAAAATRAAAPRGRPRPSWRSS